MLVFGFVRVVDHIIGVVVASGYDQPITCISLNKSTSTTPSASTFGIFGVYSLGSIGVEVLNLLIIVVFL